MRSPFEPTRIGSTVLPNRLVMAPIKTGYGTVTGESTPRHEEFYVRRAQGGVGLVTLEPMYIHSSGKELPTQMGIHTDEVIDSLARLIDRIHHAGAKVAIHLNHAGRMANPKAAPLPLVSASAVACPATGVVPRELTPAEIDQTIALYSQAARRARLAGADALELQAGHGYLIAQFLSPLVNHRTDAYGGSLENRMRFGLEVLRGVKSEAGELPVICRLSGREFFPGGITLEESIPTAVALERMGADAIHVGGGSACESPAWYFQHSALPEGAFLADARAVKRSVSIPVITVGRLGRPARVTEALATGGVDLIALGRPLVADPDFPRKMHEERHDDICFCGSCLQGCLAMVKAGKGLSCVINPTVGREGELRLQAAERPKKVIVVGGGPAGLEAAIVAAARGHRVDLYEKGELGGQLRLAWTPPTKDNMKVLYDHLLARMRTSQIRIHTGIEVDADMIGAQRPDAVVVATGAEPVVPDIPGLKSVNHATGHDVLSGAKTVGPSVLVIGGGMVGMETAEYLAARGRAVTVVEMLEDIARDMEPITRTLLLKRIAHLPVTVLTGTTVKRCEPDRVVIERGGGEAELPRFASVVLAVGTRSVSTLTAELRQRGVAVYTVGDAKSPRRLVDAVHEGFEAGFAV